MATSKNIPSRSNWLNFNKDDSVLDKQKLINYYMRDMFNKTCSMIEAEGLPEKVNKKDLLYILFKNGYITWLNYQGDIYALDSTLGGEYDYNFLPTKSIVTNPYLKLSKEYTINEDCVVMRCDSSYSGLWVLFKKYAQLLAECDISLQYGAVNSRIPVLITVDNENDKDTANKLLTDLWSGKEYGILLNHSFKNQVTGIPYGGSTSTYISQLIELAQYIKASFWIDMGLNSNFNMKREALNDSEVNAGDATLKPRIDDILNNLNEGAEEVNKMFNLNISFKLASAWKDEEVIQDLTIEKLQAEAENILKGEDKEPKEEKEKDDEASKNNEEDK